MIKNLDKSKLPKHVAIIMDGNGRWAKLRGLPRVFGHREGAKTVEKTLRFARNIGIKHLSLFAFSTENWGRPKDEVNAIFGLLVDYINSKIDELKELGVRLRFMGRIEELPDYIKESVKKGEEETSSGKDMDLIVALNYSGKAEIIDAVKKAVLEGRNINSEEDFRNLLYLPDLPDVDLLIRTSGEIRISNFMLWQIAYSELYFTEVLWPDFNEREFTKALLDYQYRERRFGKI